MDREYKYLKNKFMTKPSIVEIILENGESIFISKTEIVEISLKIGDKLLLNCYEGIIFNAAEGRMVFKINNELSKLNNDIIWSVEENFAQRKEYIEHRMTKDSIIQKVVFYNSNHNSLSIVSCFKAVVHGDYLVINCHFDNEYESPYASIYLNDINLENVRSIHFDFENCDGITVYSHEIIDLQLEYKSRLNWGAMNLCREIKGGYVIIKLDNNCSRTHELFLENDVSPKNIAKRFFGLDKNGMHDICHLYISRTDIHNWEECLEIETIRFEDDFKDLVLSYEDEYYEAFISGFSKKRTDGAIIIAFGKDAKKIVKAICKKYKRTECL